MTGSANKTEQPPAWNVIAVFDPDSSGSGFAYTDGLAADGFPELHVWSQPTDGVDPGVGFKLSAEDMAAVLSGCAKRILTGELHLGDKFTEEFDASQSTGRFTLTGPVDPATVDAFRLSPDTKVITLPWSLQRPPEGPRIEVDEQTATTILDTARTWTGRIARLGASNEDLLAVQNATVDTTQRFGPWTSVVRAASIAVRADADLSAFELGLGAATVRSQVLATLALVNAAARLVGRSDVLVEVASQATADTLEVLTSASDFASRFPGDSDDPDEAALVMEAVQHSLSSALTLAYSAWALADVLDLEVFQTATGLLEAAFADEDDASWFERPEVKELLDSAAQLPTETASRLPPV